MKLWPAPPSLKNNVHERSDDLEKERRVTEGGLVSPAPSKKGCF